MRRVLYHCTTDTDQIYTSLSVHVQLPLLSMGERKWYKKLYKIGQWYNTSPHHHTAKGLRPAATADTGRKEMVKYVVLWCECYTTAHKILAKFIQKYLPFSLCQCFQWQLDSNPWHCDDEASVLPLYYRYWPNLYKANDLRPATTASTGGEKMV